MKKGVVLLVLLFLVLILGGWFFLASPEVVVLNPKGAVAVKQRSLLITATLLMCLVVIPVFLFTILFAWRYREENDKAKYTPEWAHNHLAECLWWGIPCLIIAALAWITWTSSHDLNPYKPIQQGQEKPLAIQVVALSWKWLFLYPEQGIATVNFLQFPEKTPLAFEITADAPMNSFWIPQLGGQIYAMPGMKTQLHLMAHEPGSFRGSSAQLSGDGFAGMVFTAKATTQGEFEKWVEEVKGSSNRLSAKEYSRLVEPSAYEPMAQYASIEEGLFDWIVMKYDMPMEKK